MPRLMCKPKPYLGLALKVDLRVMAELMVQSGLAPPREQELTTNRDTLAGRLQAEAGRTMIVD